MPNSNLIFTYSNSILFLFFNFKIYILSILYKVVISICQFVCPIITQEPLDRFVSNFDWGTRENHGSDFSLDLRF